MTLLYGPDKAVSDFVCNLLPHCRERGMGPAKAIGVLDSEGRLIGGIMFHDWCPERGTIEVSGAGITPKWFSRSLLAAIGEYVFEQVGCQAMVSRHSAENKRLLRIWPGVGATTIPIPRLFGRNEDGVWVVYTDDDWARSPYNRKRQKHEQP